MRHDNGLLINEEGVPVCSAVSVDQPAPNQMDLDLAHIMEMELRAMYYWQMGDTEQTESWLKQATQLQEETSYSFGLLLLPNLPLNCMAIGYWLNNAPLMRLLNFRKPWKEVLIECIHWLPRSGLKRS